MKRRSFLTSLSVLAATTILPNIGSKKVYINSTSNANRNISNYNTNGIERIRITSSGNVCIGTTTDSGFKLNV